MLVSVQRRKGMDFKFVTWWFKRNSWLQDIWEEIYFQTST